MRKPQLFDSIALLEDIPEAGLERGNVGAVVEIYREGEGYEVEFVDVNGRTYGLTTLSPDQFVLLSREAVTERIAA